MPREKSAGAIIFRREPLDTPQGKKYQIFYLLLHYPSKRRKGGHWEFSKGHVEAGESEEKTVKREVFEETGIKDLKILPGFKRHIKYFFRQYPKKAELAGSLRQSSAGAPRSRVGSAGEWVFKLVTFFVAETKTKEIKISHEHDAFVWLPIEEAVKKTTFKNSKKLLEAANDFVTNHKT